VAQGKPKRQEISVAEADLMLWREHLGEEVDLIEGAHVHARGDVRISLGGDEMEDLLDCVAEAVGGGAVTAELHAQEHPPNRQASQTQNSSEGQKISLCEVPETQPKAREDSGTVVLPALSGCDR
jgi:hypothetical protein